MIKPTRTRSGWELRLRLGGGERLRLLMPHMADDVAQERAARLEAMRDLLRDNADLEQIRQLLTEAAAQVDATLFDEAELVARELAGGGVVSPPPVAIRTFRDACEAWTSGALHERFPDRVGPLTDRYRSALEFRLGHICKTIGNIPLARLTKADCERALAELPPQRMQSTRSEYARLIPRVLRLAVLADALEHSPLPTGWAPGRGERREFQLLYPDEDAQLIRCGRVAWERRLLWGFLVREGLRVEEALSTTWADFDLERGTIVVPDSKTGKMRRWRLGEDVRLALSAHQERTGEGGKRGVFPSLYAAAAQFRQDLLLCALRRRELHETTATSRNVTVHDLRGTFVTIALAAGKPLPWIMTRTGHTRTDMVDRYRRAVDFALEHEMKWFDPLHTGLGVGQDDAMPLVFSRESHRDRVPGTLSDSPSAHQTSNVGAASTGQDDAVEPPSPPSSGGGREVGPPNTSGAEEQTAGRERSLPSAPADPIAQAIADLALSIRLAAQAGEWGFAAKLEAKLDRLTAMQSGVASLETARAKRNGDKP